MTSTMASEDCFSWAAISRLPAKDPLTVNSFKTIGASLVVFAALVVTAGWALVAWVWSVVAADVFAACANADAGAMENRPTTASMIRLARVFGFDLSVCIVRVLREFVMHVHRGLLQALVRANVGVLSQRMHGSGSKRIHREPPSATPNAFKKPI
jgi:hypothetical protein